MRLPWSLCALIPSLVACGGSSPRPATPTGPAVGTATEPAKAASPPEPPAKRLTELKLGETRVMVEECTIDPPLKAAGDPIKSITRVGNRLYLADGTEDLRAYTIKPGCQLVADESFGNRGVLKLGGRAELLSSDAQGNVLASTGVFDAWLIKNGKATSCGHRHAALHPSGTWGLTTFANTTVEKLTVGKDGKCTVAPWALRDLNDDAKRVGPFSSAGALAFAFDRAWVGGILAKGETRVVIGFDAAGKELVRFGGTKVPAPDAFGWVHAISPCGPGLCVADANFQTVSAWTREGKLVGQIKLGDILKEGLPWAQTLAEQDGKLLVGVSLRPREGETTGRLLRLVFGQ